MLLTKEDFKTGARRVSDDSFISYVGYIEWQWELNPPERHRAYSNIYRLNKKTALLDADFMVENCVDANAYIHKSRRIKQGKKEKTI